MSAEPTPLSRVTRVATTRIPTRHAEFNALAYRDQHTSEDHVVLVLGDVEIQRRSRRWSGCTRSV